MITVKKTFSFPLPYPLERLGDPEKTVFFDIETTGFSGASSSLYLIGCIYRRDGAWQFIQWFADGREAEKECLTAFFQFLRDFSVLVHFNGDGFDIPYITKRLAAHGLSYDFSGVTSVDIYRLIRPYQKILGLKSIRQKAVEDFLGVGREDKFNGGQLIEVYWEYVSNRDQRLLHLLLLHNEDDLKGMPSILPILFYRDFWEGQFSAPSPAMDSPADVFGRRHPQLSLTCTGSCRLPIPLSCEADRISMKARDDTAVFTIPLLEDTLKYYYSDYKDYYYLPMEDRAIHKSVAQYVDRDARKKATKSTCYAKKAGLFLPQPAPIWEPCLRRDLKDPELFVPYSDELFQQKEAAGAYIRRLLELLKRKA